MGPITANGMGLQPVTWQELQAWRESSGTHCDPWELEQVKMLSMVYLDQFNKAEKPDCPAPWIDPDFVDHAALSDKIKKQFRAFRRAKAKK